MNSLTVYRASAGTGKTYTLALRYIGLLLSEKHDFGFRNILCVTFTNKATAEMKQRILDYLYDIAEGRDNDNERKKFIKNLSDYHPPLTDEVLRQRTRQLYHNILADYDNMKVVTIDSFLQTLITGMAQMLGIGADFSVTLDMGQALQRAVDELMTTHLQDYPEARRVLSEYIDLRIDDEKSWDVRKSIFKMSKNLMAESVLKSEDEIELDPKKILDYSRSLYWHHLPQVQELDELVMAVEGCRRRDDIEGGRNYYAFIDRILDSLSGHVDKKKLFAPLGDREAKGLRKETFIQKLPEGARGREIHETLLRMQQITEDMRDSGLTCKIKTNDFIREHLNDLSTAGFVKKRLDENLAEQNSILLARTAYVLSQALKPGDADFILEKSGVRYRHIMIDEFQDTSTLQWQIFSQLVEEILASGGTTLIVGDVKQSIYRWRNGDYKIMQQLGYDTPKLGAYFAPRHLTRNFRSQSRIMEFNLSLFKHLVSEGQEYHSYESLYREGDKGYERERLAEFHSHGDKEDGYVCFRAYPCVKPARGLSPEQQSILPDIVKGQIAQDMFETIERLLATPVSNPKDKVRASDILILIRNNDEAVPLLDAYAQSSLPEQGVSLSSAESFLLESSFALRVLINALTLLCKKDDIAHKFLEIHKVDIEGLMATQCDKPLYELVEEVVAKVLMRDGQLRWGDATYLNCFMDELRSFVSSSGSDLENFLQFWEDSLHTKAIASEDSDGIRLMTIHKAKGLEASHVFIPYCSWDMLKQSDPLWVEDRGTPMTGKDVGNLGLVPVSFYSRLKDSAYSEEFVQEFQQQQVDNLNLLYVALTRAKDNLFIYSPLSPSILKNEKKKKDEEEKNRAIGELIFNHLKYTPVNDEGQTLSEAFELAYAKAKPGERPPFCQYEFGDSICISGKKDKSNTPFKHHYTSDDSEIYNYYSSDQNVCFRQSQESAMHMQGDEERTASSLERMAAGTLRHNILSEIQTMADTPKIIERYLRKGLIETRAQAQEIAEELERTWKNPQMRDWFSGRHRLLREVAILRPLDEYTLELEEWKTQPKTERTAMPRRELRPDRVMIDGSKAIVLDFKFGKQNHHKYSQQVKGYCQLLRQMGYTEVEGWLWYGFDCELVEVKQEVKGN